MKVLMVWAMACVAMMWSGVAVAAPNGGKEVRRYALLVGANDGGDERVRLRYAGTDAEAMSKVLAQLGGIPEREQMLVMDPSVAQVESAFSKLGAKIKREKSKRAEVLVYYSGHSDEQGLLLKGGARMTYAQLRAQLDALPVEVRVVVLDSCSSGAMTRTKGGKRVASFLEDESIQVKGQAILTSSSADEVAQESDTLGGSFFTHALIAGLRGAADVTGDRRVTLNEAYQFAFQETLERTEKTRGGAQHAAYDIHLTGQGDLVLTDLTQTSATLEIGAKVDGRVSVRDEAGDLAIELKKVAGRPLELALPAKRYEVRWVRSNGTLMVAKVDMARGSRARVRASAFEQMSREATVSRGGTLDSSDEVLPVGVDLFPYVGTSSVYPGHERWFSLNIAGGVSGGVRVLEIGAAANVVDGDMQGLEIAGAANVVTGEVRALQIAAAHNLAMSGLMGGQLGGTNLILGGGRGVQIGGINGVTGSLRGGQLGGVNVVEGGMIGAQVGAVNTMMGDTAGVQFGAVNVATGDVTGVQFGAINVSTGDVQGFQFGVINVADTTTGAFGVLNFFWNGRTQLEAWGTEALGANVGVRHGSGATYNVYSVGTNLLGDRQTLTTGLGIGFQREITAHFGVNVDAMGQVILVPDQAFRLGGNINKLRLTATFSPFEWLTFFGGPTANVMLTDCSSVCSEYLPFGSYEATDPDAGFRVFLWPGAVFGARF